MASIETGCPYVVSFGSLTATFNVSTDPNFVGYIDDVTGLDFYGVRENAQVFSGADGGYHGPFWRDRRPFTLTGFIFPVTPVAVRNAAQDKLMQVLGNCLRSDGTLTWTHTSDNIQRGVNFRLQQPIRITKGQSNIQKRFLIAGVVADWRILTWAGSSVAATLGTGALPLVLSPTNNGTADAAPSITITGPINTPVVTNTTTGKKFTLTGNVAAGQSVVINLAAQPYPTITYGGIDWSQYVDPLNSDYTLAVAPSSNNIQLGSTSGTPGTTGATGLAINWNDSWH